MYGRTPRGGVLLRLPTALTGGHRWSRTDRLPGRGRSAISDLHVVVKPTGHPFRVTASHEARLPQQFETPADATLLEHPRMFKEATGLKVSYKSGDGAFARLTITHRETLVAREWSEERRAAFQGGLRLTFSSQSDWFTTSTTQGYTRAPSHLHATGQVARNHGLKYISICTAGLAGPLVIDETIKGVTFGMSESAFAQP